MYQLYDTYYIVSYGIYLYDILMRYMLMDEAYNPENRIEVRLAMAFTIRPVIILKLPSALEAYRRTLNITPLSSCAIKFFMTLLLSKRQIYKSNNI